MGSAYVKHAFWVVQLRQKQGSSLPPLLISLGAIKLSFIRWIMNFYGGIWIDWNRWISERMMANLQLFPRDLALTVRAREQRRAQSWWNVKVTFMMMAGKFEGAGFGWLSVIFIVSCCLLLVVVGGCRCSWSSSLLVVFVERCWSLLGLLAAGGS